MPPPTAEKKVRLAGLALVLAVAAAYADSLRTPFVFDDGLSIASNPTIRHLGALREVLSPPVVGAVCSRPLVNLSLAVNYAISGMNPWSYHALNLAIHALAALALFGLVRRTLPAPAAAGTAFVAALLWALHPLLTESVTFVIQRTESLMGLCYLATLYCFARGARGAPRPWFALCVLACLAGMASKEVMVSAPLMVLLYDRTFVAGTFGAAWRQRRPLYLALAATWIPLADWVLASGANRDGAAGFGTGIPWWIYGLTQGRAIVHYLRLAFWPAPLIVDYGERVVRGVGEAAPQAIAVALLLAGTLLALRRRPALGFLGAWFFAILAPSSSILPLATQTVAEHRMYLPLAAVAVLFAVGLRAAFGRRGLAVGVALAAVLGGLTARRNRDYRSEVALWTDTVGKLPDNPRAHYNLGVALDQAQAVPAAMGHYREAIRLKPDYVEAHNNLANDLQRVGRVPEALAEIEEAVRLKPGNAEARYNLGNALYALGRAAAAIEPYRAALQLRSDYPEAHNNLGVALFALGRTGEAIAEYAEAARLDPHYAPAQYDWGNALAETGRIPEAIGHYEATLRLDPRHAGAETNLGNALAAAGQPAAAIRHYAAALALQPDNPRVRYDLGNVLAQSGQPAAAAEQYREALRLRPDFPAAQAALAQLAAAAAAR
jgi:tetratricopeptide (TPR) repeat protein